MEALGARQGAMEELEEEVRWRWEQEGGWRRGGVKGREVVGAEI